MTNFLTKDNKRFPIVDISEIVFYEQDDLIIFESKQHLKQDGYTFDEPRWKPSANQMYKLIDHVGNITEYKWEDDRGDNFRYSTGNVFKPDDTAGIEAYKQKLLELGK